MKKNKISAQSAGEATISYSNFKIAECGRGTPPPTPTPRARLAPSVQALRAFSAPFPPAVSPPFFSPG